MVSGTDGNQWTPMYGVTADHPISSVLTRAQDTFLTIKDQVYRWNTDSERLEDTSYDRGDRLMDSTMRYVCGGDQSRLWVQDRLSLQVSVAEEQLMTNSTLFLRRELYSFSGWIEMMLELSELTPELFLSLMSVNKDTRSRLMTTRTWTHIWAKTQLTQTGYYAFTAQPRSTKVVLYSGPGVSV